LKVFLNPQNRRLRGRRGYFGTRIFLFDRRARRSIGGEMGKLIHEKLSGEIIGAAMDVLNEMKPGLDEKLYERALVIELRKRGHALNRRRNFLSYIRTS
jgi:PD-(D/E)XK nuclease superfamily